MMCVCVCGQGGCFQEGGGGGGVTLEMCAIVPCNVDQAVCTVHMHSSLPWCWGQASSTSGRGDLCEACKQSNATIGSDDVTRSTWTDNMTVVDS